MIRRRLRSADGTRGAEVYLCAGTLSTYRIRVEKYPEHWDHMGDASWWGGRVLWGHDQPTMTAAVEVANRWVIDGALPAVEPATYRCHRNHPHETWCALTEPA
ncbi:hypothetical protein AB0J20_16400 [Micromonospora costi]|uniref:hypothetical protein n=1 Tax=Micromonospora costi TaxID=1530042 RepID=UPI0033D4CD58